LSRQIEVLVLDDEPIVCERFRDYLVKKGMSVETFVESRKALDRIKEKSFDVIVTDMKMEGPTGLDVLVEVKKGSHEAEVIIMTGYGAFESYREAGAVGVFDYIAKPFKMADMYKLIRKAARKAQRRKK
jgi:DNA-binding NtrC family response regulator